MSVTRKTFWLGTRVGIVGATCYYTNQSGLWGSSSETELLYKELYKAAAPYTKQTPIEIPELPRMSDISRSVVQSWNGGVISSTEFLLHLPTHVSNWATAAYNTVNELVSDPSPPTA